MINLENEKKSVLSAKDMNDLMSFAVGEAENNGYINRYVFERAMYTYLYLLLCDKEEKGEIQDSFNENGVLVVWQELVASGKIEKMLEEHPVEVQLVVDACNTTFEDYTGYAKSVRAAMTSIQSVGNDVMRNSLKQMSEMLTSEQYQDIMDIAEKWGMSKGGQKA